jgi:MFS family permease
MATMRGFLAILAGVLVAGIIGAAYDYIRPDFIPNPMEYKFAWPWFFAVSGAVAALIAVVLYGLWQGSAESGTERPRKPAKPKVVKPTGKSA